MQSSNVKLECKARIESSNRKKNGKSELFPFSEPVLFFLLFLFFLFSSVLIVIFALVQSSAADIYKAVFMPRANSQLNQ
jgi:hypothetical protein